jgi:Uma2 family endonuclease
VPMTYDEFSALGETKHHEYYDGLCVVNPPARRHVLVAKRLGRLLDDHCPPGYTTYPEWGWRTDEGDFEPDLMVASVDAPDDQFVGAPLLVVEVLSPASRLDDLVTKRDKYALAGAAWYWIVDCDTPSITVMRNASGRFVEVQRIAEASVPTVGPFPVTVDPGALLP